MTAKWMQLIECPEEGCATRPQRNNIASHMMRVHDWTREPATQLAHSAPGIDRYPVTVQETISSEEIEDNMTSPKWTGAVVCPADNCGRVLSRRNNLSAHLQGKHKWEHHRALRATRNAAPAPEPETAVVETLPAVIPTPPVKRGPGRPKVAAAKIAVDWSEVDPAEIAVGVIETQVPGSTIPIVMLAEIVAYVDHTRRVVEQLRALH